MGVRGLHKVVTSKVTTTVVHSLGSGQLARDTNLQAACYLLSIADSTSSQSKG